MTAAHAAAGVELRGATDVHRVWSGQGYTEACLQALDAVPDAVRGSTTRQLLEDAGVGLSNRALDRLLGFDVEGVADLARRRIDDDPELEGKWCWQGPGEDVTQTRYEDFVALARTLDTGTHIVDLGSGFGRLGFVLGLLRPDVRFTGLEVVRERVAESVRVTRALGLSRGVVHRCADLAHHRVPDADAYFLFFSFPEPTAAHVLDQLRDVARVRRISIIVHGMWPGQDLDDVAWLRPAPSPEPFCRYVSVD
ncbi:MAG: hypothetical protein AAGA54_17895 [Myxococcota bacterium]